MMKLKKLVEKVVGKTNDNGDMIINVSDITETATFLFL